MENERHISPMNVNWGVIEAVSAIKKGTVDKDDRAAILAIIQKHDSRADESDVDVALRRLQKQK